MMKDPTRLARGLAASGCIALGASACGGQPADRQDVSPTSPGAIGLSADAGSAPAADMDVHQLARQVAQLRHEVADLRIQLTQERSGASTDRPPPAHDPRSDPQARADAEVAEAQRIAARESSFRAEPVDAAWRTTTETSVRAALAGGDTPLGESVLSLECRSQTCRMEVAFGDPAATARMLPRMLMRLASTLPRATAGRVGQDDGSQATVLYLAR